MVAAKRWSLESNNNNAENVYGLLQGRARHGEALASPVTRPSYSPTRNEPVAGTIQTGNCEEVRGLFLSTTLSSRSWAHRSKRWNTLFLLPDPITALSSMPLSN